MFFRTEKKILTHLGRHDDPICKDLQERKRSQLVVEFPQCRYPIHKRWRDKRKTIKPYPFKPIFLQDGPQ